MRAYGDGVIGGGTGRTGPYEADAPAHVTAADVAALFPVPVGACVAGRAMYAAGLFASEETSLAQARGARRGEFAAGRASAREALAALGQAAIALPVGPGRAPVWPDGFVGSITHTEGLCAAVAARRRDVAGLGLDAEGATPLPGDLERLVCMLQDYPPAPVRAALGEVAWSKVVFSVKEAFYKAQYPLTRRFLDFGDVEVAFAPSQTREGGGFTVGLRPAAGAGAAPGRARGRWRILDGLVLAGVWLPGVEG